jgi:hypothetical protein
LFEIIFLEHQVDVVVEELVHDALDVFMGLHSPTPLGVNGSDERTFLRMLLLLLLVLFIVVGFFLSFFTWIFK